MTVSIAEEWGKPVPGDEVIAHVDFICEVCGDPDSQEVTRHDKRQGYVLLHCARTGGSWEYDLKDAFDQPPVNRETSPRQNDTTNLPDDMRDLGI